MFYLDKPISSIEQDQLNRKHFTNVLAHALQRQNNEESFTVGIYGKWGVGKSSLINLLKKSFKMRNS
jgi:predicted KAP-like P-loop ATPase